MAKKGWKQRRALKEANKTPQEFTSDILAKAHEEVSKSTWQQLKEAGFPQGGVGTWLKDPNSDEKYYIPHPAEVYQLFIANPQDWEKMSEAMAKIWLQNRK